MSERFSTPDQADKLTHTLRTTLADKGVKDKGSYLEYYNPMVFVPKELEPYLPPDPVRVGATAKLRSTSNDELPEAALKLSWEYNPVESARRAGDPNWLDASRDRGTNFVVWHTHRNPSHIQRVSGMYEQPPIAPADSLMNISTERLLELADEQRLMAEAAEMQAWRRVEAGITDPRIVVDEAALLIAFARHL